jgi:hypothetical protein
MLKSHPSHRQHECSPLHSIPLSKDVYEGIKNNITKTNGCNDQILQCRAADLAGDPYGTSRNAAVNKLCVAATDMCFFTYKEPIEIRVFRL